MGTWGNKNQAFGTYNSKFFFFPENTSTDNKDSLVYLPLLSFFKDFKENGFAFSPLQLNKSLLFKNVNKREFHKDLSEIDMKRFKKFKNYHSHNKAIEYLDLNDCSLSLNTSTFSFIGTVKSFNSLIYKNGSISISLEIYKHVPLQFPKSFNLPYFIIKKLSQHSTNSNSNSIYFTFLSNHKTDFQLASLIKRESIIELNNFSLDRGLLTNKLVFLGSRNSLLVGGSKISMLNQNDTLLPLYSK
ncbi:hypothetical protein AYI69_g4050 [Smittium culicis]|uniref:Uncharacterized protein n=1 Tax=Smittium culicis TaxID=133412 RepID=A0A1R1YH38_9FUNG|nr:hypothetical protein AYI69_g4050 [Smittium culicis]